MCERLHLLSVFEVNIRLRVPERIQFRLCVLAFRCRNGSAPPYLAESVRRTADVEGRRHLRSSTTMTLVVR